MVHLGSLWLPILLASVLVFFVSFLVHMVLKYHHRDYTKLPNEDAVRAAIRSGNPPPAQYIIPYCPSPKDMQTPEMKKKYEEGPLAVMNIIKPGHARDGQESGPVVRFLAGRLPVHCLRRLPRTPARRPLYGRVPCRRGHRVSGLCRRGGPALDLDGQALEHHLERGVRWAAIRAGDGRNLRMAVAALR